MLTQANVPEDLWKHCYIVDEIIYTPRYDEGGVMTETGLEVYEESLVPVSPEPQTDTTEQLLNIILGVS